MPRQAKIIPFPRPHAAAAATTEAAFVEVRRCRNQGEALVVRGLLESRGIRVLLRSNLAHSVYPFSVGDQGEVVLLTPPHDAPRARAILARR
jgi:hypothetical protein